MNNELKASQALLDENSQDFHDQRRNRSEDEDTQETSEPNQNLLGIIRDLRKEISDSQLNFDHERELFNTNRRRKMPTLPKKSANFSLKAEQS